MCSARPPLETVLTSAFEIVSVAIHTPATDTTPVREWNPGLLALHHNMQGGSFGIFLEAF